ncbi:hypothetical protein J5N97_014281 [Dioscorea zingiberensis]|uniref:RING-type E3 ubiquitin transferase n=1 Tax=Dioscorea zingiberensis TaxID=325984 RepID=A0A9D5CUH4_9LILI|nr:hypothetical protein J5N97_014281 [Dioscorea zingiberensis]
MYNSPVVIPHVLLRAAKGNSAFRLGFVWDPSHGCFRPGLCLAGGIVSPNVLPAHNHSRPLYDGNLLRSDPAQSTTHKLPPPFPCGGHIRRTCSRLRIAILSTLLLGSESILHADHYICALEIRNVAVVKKWVEVASKSEIVEAIDIPEGRELVRILLAAGANPTAQDEHFRTALHTAAMVNDAELLKIILEAGVDVNIINTQNTTPLHVALNRGADQCVGLLLSAGANCNMQDEDGDNAFHIAADAAKMIRENLKWIVVMLQYPYPDIEVRNHRFGWRGQSRDSIGTVLCVDDDGILRVGFPGASRGWRADPAEMERFEEFKVGDWVRIRPSLTAAIHGLESVTPGSIGIVYSIRPDSSLLLGLCYLPNPWHCEPEEVERVEPFEVGDWVRVKASVPSPKYGWEDVSRNSIGVIHSLEDNGDVGVAFCFRSKAFPCSVADMEKVRPFEVGEKIHVIPSISQPRLGWSNETAASIGTIARIDMDGTLNVRVAGKSSLWKVAPGDAERLSGFEVGDWVRLKPSLGNRHIYDWNSVGKESIAVVHSIQDSGYLELAGCFRKSKWSTHYMDVEKVPCLKIGQHVHFRAGLLEPRWGWRDARSDSRGIISGVHADGEVRVAFFGLSGLWRGDPADLEKEEMFEVGAWVRLKDNASGWKSIKPGSIGIVHGIGYDGEVWDGTVHVAFCGEQERWIGPANHLKE